MPVKEFAIIEEGVVLQERPASIIYKLLGLETLNFGRQVLMLVLWRIRTREEGMLQFIIQMLHNR